MCQDQFLTVKYQVLSQFADLRHADFSHSMKNWMFRFKLVLIVHFLSVCDVSAVASGERVHLGLSTISPPVAAIMKIDEHRRKQYLVIIMVIIIIIIINIVIVLHTRMMCSGTLFFTITPLKINGLSSSYSSR